MRGMATAWGKPKPKLDFPEEQIGVLKEKTRETENESESVVVSDGFGA